MQMLAFIEKYERFVYMFLIGMLMIVILFGLGQLVYETYVELTNYPFGLLENQEMLTLLGIFLLILIGVELLGTMVEYLKKSTIHVEIVVLLAIIAIARKVILLDPNNVDGVEMIGVGVVIMGLAGAYYLLKKAGYSINLSDQKTQE